MTSRKITQKIIEIRIQSAINEKNGQENIHH